jgi:hypothetical protein
LFSKDWKTNRGLFPRLGKRAREISRAWESLADFFQALENGNSLDNPTDREHHSTSNFETLDTPPGGVEKGAFRTRYCGCVEGRHLI